MPILKFNVEADYKEVIRLREEIANLESQLKSFGPGTAESTIKSLQNQLSLCREQFQRLTAEAASAGASVERNINGELAKLRANSNVNVKINASTSGVRKEVLQLDGDIEKSLRNLDSYGQQLTRTFSNISSIAGFTAPLVGIMGFLEKVKSTRTYFQDIESTMEVLLGSKDKSDEFVAKLEKAAYYNMFEYADLVDASKQMIAYGVETDKIIPKIDQLSEVATATKASLGEMVSMYNRAKAIGYVDSRALQTWATHGLVVKDVMKEMGIEAKGNKVTFEQLNQVLDHVTGEGGMFHNVMSNQMQNISAEIGALEDNTSLMFNEIGKKVEGPLTKFVHFVAEDVVGNWEDVAVKIAGATIAFAAFKGGMKMDKLALNSELDDAQEKIDALTQSTRKMKLGGDLESSVKAGTISQADAEKLQESRNLLEKESKKRGHDVTLEELEQEREKRAQVIEAIEEQKQKVIELQRLQEANSGKYDADITEGLRDGSYSVSQAQDMQNARKAEAQLRKSADTEIANAQKELDSAVSESTYADKLLEDARKSEEAAKIEMDAARNKLDELKRIREEQMALLDSDDETGFSSDAIENYVSEAEIAEAETRALATEKAYETAVSETQTAETMAAGAAKAKEAAQTNAGAIAEKNKALSTKQSTVATTQETVAENANSVAKGKNRIATMASAVGNKLFVAGQKIVTAATNEVSAALNRMKVALLTNPITFLAGAIGMLLPYLLSFGKDTNDVSAEEEKFGESTLKTKSKVETLYSALSTANENTNVYKNALKELKQIAKDYGIVITNENRAYEELCEKKEKLIELIENEGVARQTANRMAAIQKDMDSYEEDMDKEIDKILEKNSEKIKNNAGVYKLLIKQDLEEQKDAVAKLTEEYQKLEDDKTPENRRRQMEIEKELIALASKRAKIVAAQQGEEFNLQTWNTRGFFDAGKAIVDYTSKTEGLNDALAEAKKLSEDVQDSLSKNKEKAPIDYKNMALDDVVKGLSDIMDKKKELSKDATVKVDSSEVDKASKKADDLKNKVEEVSSKTAKPKGDSSEISNVKDKVDETTNAANNLSETTAKPQGDPSEINNVNDSTNNAIDSMFNLDNAFAFPTADDGSVLGLTSSVNTAIGTMSTLDSKTATPKTDNKWLALTLKYVQKIRAFMQSLGIIGEGDVKEDTSEPKVESGLSKEEKTDEKERKNRLKEEAKNVKSNEDASQLKAKLKTLQDKAEWGSEDYKFYKGLIEDIDKRDPSKKNKSGGKKDDPLQRAYDLAKTREAESKRLKKLEQKRLQDEEELRIKMMHDGTQKEIEQARFDAKKKEEELEDNIQSEMEKLKDVEMKEWLKQGKDRKNYQWQQKQTDEQYLEQARKNLGAETKLAEIRFEESKKLQEIYEKQTSDYIAFVKEYGNIEEQRYAITKEYNDKIAKAETMGQRLQLEGERDKALEELKLTELDDSVTWDAMFSTIDMMSLNALNDVVAKIKDELNDSTIPMERMNELYERLAQVQEVVAERQNAWKDSLLGGIPILGDYLASQKRLADLKQKEADAQAKVNQIEVRKNYASMKAANAKNSVINMFKSLGVDLNREDVSLTQEEELRKKLLDAGGNEEDFDKIFNPFASATKDLNKISIELEDASSESEQASKNIAEAQKSGMFAGVNPMDVAGSITSLVNANMQSAADFFNETLDLADTGFAKGFSDFAESTNYMSQAFESFKSGDLFGVLNNLNGALGSLGNALGNWGIDGFGDSDNQLEEDIEELTRTNQELIRAMKNLIDEMRDASISDAAELYKQAKQNYDAASANTQNLMMRSGAVHNDGFMGMGGKHSSNYYINDAMSSADWARISKAAGVSVSNASDFWNLTSEQMAKVADQAPDLYAKIKGLADDGYKDASQYMDDYIEYYKQLEDLQDAYYQSLTDTDFDSIRNEFRSALMNMESDAQTFTENFENMMRQAVINSLMTEIFDEQLKTWYESFAKAMESDAKLTAQEQDDLKRQYDRMVQDGLARRDELMKIMGWDSSATQQSSSRTLQGMSQDTGNAIEGRLTAIQIAVESIRAEHQIEAKSIADLNDNTLAMIQQAANNNVYCENLDKHVAKIYSEVVEINEKTGDIVEALGVMQNNVEQIKKKL